MISWEVFQSAMKEVCLLTGQNPAKEQMQAIYRKIQNSNISDFKKACDDDKFLEEWSYKVNYPSLKRAIEKYASERIEQEARLAKRKEEEETRRLMESEGLPDKVREFLAGMCSYED
jgi:cation transport regulator ChaB